MTVYTVLPSDDRNPESPVTPELVDALYFNPTAIAEGSTGAPKIRPKAFGVESGYMYLGDESDGTLNYASTTNIASDEKYCSSFNVQSGVTLGVSESSNGFLVIRCTGTATIAGTINLDGKGGIGGVLGVTTATAGVAGGAGLLGGNGGGGTGSSTPVAGGNGGSVYGTLTPDLGSANNTTSLPDAEALSTQSESFLERHAGILYSEKLVSGILGGGGGGSGATGVSVDGADGGNGGGCVIIIADEIDFTGTITCDGGGGNNQSHSTAGSAGGGGGGFVILIARNFIADTGSITVTGGAGGSGSGYNAATGADGHSASITVS